MKLPNPSPRHIVEIAQRMIDGGDAGVGVSLAEIYVDRPGWAAFLDRLHKRDGEEHATTAALTLLFVEKVLEDYE